MEQRDFISLSFNLSTKKKENRQNCAFSIGTKIDCIKSFTVKSFHLKFNLLQFGNIHQSRILLFITSDYKTL